MISDAPHTPDIAARKDRMAVLAHAPAARLADLWATLNLRPTYRLLRGPEAGLITLRGRIGGAGEPFNMGEATVTRASVVLADGAVGHGMTLGREPRKAELSAVIDALCHDATAAAHIDAALVAPLRSDREAADRRRREETAATRVDFFTLVRGED